VSCLVYYPVASLTFHMLVANPSPFNALTLGNAPLRAELIFNPNGRATYGGFKRASFGHSSVPVFSGSTTQVCIKQCWYQCAISGDRLPYDNATQVVKLSSEINCLRWASALMELVYDFISEATAIYGTPPFKIPTMHFVKSALAVAENDTHDTYMIEEVIDVSVDGKFVKYIGNSSAIINDFEDKDLQDRAKFLAFCQHIQYNKTQEMAFIGDYQGGRTLLTDPQIITSPDAGRIFADGNLASTHDAFTIDHSCNHFCEFFRLEPYDARSQLTPSQHGQQKLFNSEPNGDSGSRRSSFSQQKPSTGTTQPLPPIASSTRQSADEMRIFILLSLSCRITLRSPHNFTPHFVHFF